MKPENTIKVICGTDFSVHAAEAATVAAILTARLQGTLTLVHAYSEASLELPTKGAFNALHQRWEARLTEEANRLQKLGAVVKTRLLPGSPSSVLLNVAANSKARLMVVSSLGNFPPSRWLVGSVAERIAQSSPIPTLVVRGDKHFRAWAAGSRPLRVLVGYDFTATSDAALSWVAALHELGRCKVTVAYMASPQHETWRLGVGDSQSIRGHTPDITTYLERDLKERCREILGKATVRTRVADAWGPAGPQLVELAKAEKADLIVVGPSQRRGLERLWLGSVSRDILHLAPMSVACIPMATEKIRPGKAIPQVRRVLVATDFSKLGNRAIPYAYAALRRGGEVCLVHVVPPLRHRGTKSEQLEKQRATRNEELSARLRKFIPAQAEALGLRSHVEIVEHPSPAIAIAQAAERFGANLICLSSRGRSGLAKAILGSVAQAVMARSERPVLVIRPQDGRIE